MSAVTIIISIAIILVAIVVIASVLMQEGTKQGLGAIGGGAETFFGKSKAKSYEGKLAMITKIGIVVFIVLAIVMTMLVSRTGEDADTTTIDGTLLEEHDHDHDHEGEEAVEGETEDETAADEATVEPEATVEASEEPAAEPTEASDAE